MEHTNSVPDKEEQPEHVDEEELRQGIFSEREHKFSVDDDQTEREELRKQRW